ncbi:MAG: hypothetical protein C0592_00240 [Marinilabiliales bacterium]|nr:MAG: hypothetical protein C0592_00240 [Marinilabiliales bacterium]
MTYFCTKSNIMRLIILSIALFALSFSASAQGKFNLKGESGVETIVAKHIYFNENVKGFPGYRIQIFFESGNYSKNRAFGEKAKFLARYPDVAAYVVYQEPYYKVRVGNFRNKLEAEAFRQRIIEEWPEAYLIKDDIDLPGIFPPEEIK